MKATQHTNRTSTPVSKLHWVIVSPRRGTTCANDFNGTLPENGGSDELREHHKPDDGSADADIRAGRLKSCKDAEDMISALKLSW